MNLAALIAIPVFIALFVIRTALLAGGATLFVQRSAFARARRVYRRAFGDGQLRSELGAAIRVVLFDGLMLGLLRASGVIQLGDPGLALAFAQFALLFVWFELWFYGTHRLLHTRRLYFLHAQHHVAKVTHPITSMSFGLVERVLLIGGGMGFVALMSQFMPISIEAVGSYFFLNYALNVMAHTNVELFSPGFARSLPGRVFFTVSFHAMHHARYTGHYGLFTVLPDKIFKSAWDDYPEVQRRAAVGEGLATLGARVQSDVTS